MDLNKDVKYVKTVGPNRVKLLNKLKINTLKDLITYYPRDYEDRSKPKNLYESRYEDNAYSYRYSPRNSLASCHNAHRASEFPACQKDV